MKPATQRKIARALKKRIEEILGSLPADERAAKREISAALGMRGSLQANLQRAFRAGVSLGLWNEVERHLKKKPEPTPQEVEKFLREIEQVEVDSMLRSLLGSMLRKLPPFPPGKSPSLTPQQQKKAVAEVHRLTSSGRLTRRAAYEKVAKAYGVHWRTIQNLWMKTVHEQEPKGERE